MWAGNVFDLKKRLPLTKALDLQAKFFAQACDEFGFDLAHRHMVRALYQCKDHTADWQ